ncbi:hypothetical protein [uncultured Algibacter sp.]|uniref:hypothetical protein n=1 Tax=uncultured Algibacter sp. TaxID=298659 RepID=UPI00260D92F2|nr:hypothetical protein [uncultured Algibacter sp.]
MISKEEKINVLNLLLNSKTFSKSTTSNILLKYLIESSIVNKNLNASDISIELFGSQYQHEKSEATVRVNIYHLRKKLKKYFEGEGLNDSIHIEIKRGQYGVSFYKKENTQSRHIQKVKFALAAGIFILLTAGFFTYLKQSKRDPIWHAFFTNGKETTLYLYDIFGYYGPTLFNKIGWHRDYELNSSSDFYNAIEGHPDLLKDYSPGRNVYVNFLSAYSVNDLSKHFSRHKNEFKIHKFHNLSPQQLKEQNSIYLGTLKSDNAFVDFFNLKSKHVKLISSNITPKTKNIEYFDGRNAEYNEGRNIQYKDAQKNIDTIIELKSNGHSHEHVLVAKLNGDNNTVNFLFFSNHGFGGTAAVEYFTNPDSLAIFNKTHLQQSEEFVALFDVNGKERTSMHIKQVLFDDNK